MINKTFTSLLTDNNIDIFYRISDTFISNSDIYFSTPINTINNLLSESISIGNITSYKLYVRIATSISGNVINGISFEQIFNLTTSNIENNSILVNLKNITDKISHDYLCDNAEEIEIFSLFKNFKIIFRLTSNSNILNDKFDILANDICQDLNIVFNTAESGPYDVKIKEIDFLNPNRFDSYNLYKQDYVDNVSFLGKERHRIFYPENINSNTKLPLFYHSHGMGQYTSAYDFYLASIASYGYICISITTVPSGGAEGDSEVILPLINYLKNNSQHIDPILTQIDYNNIILSGHSRGGASVFSSGYALKNKNYVKNYSNLSLDYNDIKLFVSFADAHIDTTYQQYYSASATIVGNFSDESIKYFDHFLDKPCFYIKGTEDTDSTVNHSLPYRGLCLEIQRNLYDIIDLSIDNLAHGEIALPNLPQAAMAETNIVTGNPRFSFNEETTVYNTCIPKLNDIKSELIYFLAIIVFGSKKIKKLYYQDINLLDKKILKTKKSSIKRTVFEGFNNIKYLIDSYNGITLSYAGATGVTFTNIVGYTYDYAISPFLKAGTTFPATFTFANAINTKKIPSYRLNDITVNSFNIGGYSNEIYSTNDPFNGIIDVYHKGLFIPIENNFYLGYSFSSGITFLENEYLCLRGGLNLILPREDGNTMDCSFEMTLFDTSNNFATLSSKTSDQKFHKPFNKFNFGSVDYSDYYAEPKPTYINNIYFRAGDFYLQNPAINLNNINQILLSFGPDYGSTFCHIVLDEFIVLKEI